MKEVLKSSGIPSTKTWILSVLYFLIGIICILRL